MSYLGITVNSHIDAHTIASELIHDTDLAFEVFREMDDQMLDSKLRDRFIKELFEIVFEEENTGVLSLFSDILESFAHLKETDETD